jgi:predicted O-methyltransferase YrrM
VSIAGIEASLETSATLSPGRLGVQAGRRLGYLRGVFHDPTPWVVALAVLAAALVWRHRLVTRRLRKRHASDLVRQLNALNALHAELRFAAPLPRLDNDGPARPDFLLTVARHALERCPRVIVECGSGVSTLVLARCLQLNGTGHLYSLEHDPEFAGTIRGEADRQGVSERVTVLVAPIRPVTLAGRQWRWYALDALPDVEIDMLVIDGPPSRVQPLVRYVAGPVLFRRLTPGALTFLDDADRGKEHRVLKMWARQFPHLRQERREAGKGLAVLVNPH